MNDLPAFPKSNIYPLKRVSLPLPIKFHNNFQTLLNDKNEAMASMDYLDEIPTEDEISNDEGKKFSSNIFLVSCRSEEGIDNYYGSLLNKFR